MAKIKIEIDTENGAFNVTDLGPQRQLLAPKRLGILSSIDMTQSSYDLFDDIENGYGARRHAHHHNVLSGNFRNKKNNLINNTCQVIATVGGLFVNAEIIGDINNVPFVSLVGKIPTLPAGSRCVGGVSLETLNNAARRQHLLAKPGIADRSLIGLFRHRPGAQQTDVSHDEEQEWNDAGTIFESDGNFDQELNGVGGAITVPVTIKALVISAAPFFLFENNMNALVRAVNRWLSNDHTRFVVFPLQIYQEANPAPRATPMGGVKRITLLGPDLHHACEILGSVARVAQSGGLPGFQTMVSITAEL
jgi:hypothetical protein